MSEQTAIVPSSKPFALAPAAQIAEVAANLDAIVALMRGCMKVDVDFGVIPGTGKPSLYKSGAEKVGLLYGLAADFDIQATELPGNHRQFSATCTLTHRATGVRVGQGIGVCATSESKYKFRQESTNRPVPEEYWQTRNLALLGGPSFCAQKRKGRWVIVHRSEYENPPDYWNTAAKMAKKRAYIDAILTATACSAIFTQDTEDSPEIDAEYEVRNDEPRERAPRGNGFGAGARGAERSQQSGAQSRPVSSARPTSAPSNAGQRAAPAQQPQGAETASGNVHPRWDRACQAFAALGITQAQMLSHVARASAERVTDGDIARLESWFEAERAHRDDAAPGAPDPFTDPPRELASKQQLDKLMTLASSFAPEFPAAPFLRWLVTRTFEIKSIEALSASEASELEWDLGRNLGALVSEWDQTQRGPTQGKAEPVAGAK